MRVNLKGAQSKDQSFRFARLQTGPLKANDPTLSIGIGSSGACQQRKCLLTGGHNGQSDNHHSRRWALTQNEQVISWGGRQIPRHGLMAIGI